MLAADRDSLGNEHEALAARLLDGGLEKLDSATVAAAAAGLRDTSVLEKQLKRARDVSRPSVTKPLTLNFDL